MFDICGLSRLVSELEMGERARTEEELVSERADGTCVNDAHPLRSLVVKNPRTPESSDSGPEFLASPADLERVSESSPSVPDADGEAVELPQGFEGQRSTTPTTLEGRHAEVPPSRIEGIEHRIKKLEQIDLLEQRLVALEGGLTRERPWWKDTKIVALLGGLLAAIPPATTAVHGLVSQSTALALERQKQSHEFRQKDYEIFGVKEMLRQAMNPDLSPQHRARSVRFLAKVAEGPLRQWASEELALAAQVEEGELRLRMELEQIRNAAGSGIQALSKEEPGTKSAQNVRRENADPSTKSALGVVREEVDAGTTSAQGATREASRSLMSMSSIVDEVLALQGQLALVPDADTPEALASRRALVARLDQILIRLPALSIMKGSLPPEFVSVQSTLKALKEHIAAHPAPAPAAMLRENILTQELSRRMAVAIGANRAMIGLASTPRDEP